MTTVYDPEDIKAALEILKTLANYEELARLIEEEDVAGIQRLFVVNGQPAPHTKQVEDLIEYAKSLEEYA